MNNQLTIVQILSIIKISSRSVADLKEGPGLFLSFTLSLPLPLSTEIYNHCRRNAMNAVYNYLTIIVGEVP
jgi:hypothetical protein